MRFFSSCFHWKVIDTIQFRSLDNQTLPFFVPIYISDAKLNIYIAFRYIIRIKNATHTEVIFQELSLKNVLPQINKVKGDQK